MPRALMSSRTRHDRAALKRELARLPREVTTEITWRMKQLDVNKAELARRMDVSPGRVSQILSGDENVTLRTLASVCVALDAQMEVKIVGNEGDSLRDDAWSPGSTAGSGTATPADPGSSRPQRPAGVPATSSRSGRYH
jgi:transcriptional regulator with XRE-family HTH domain